MDMIAEGALDGVSGVSGVHVWPTLPSGTVASKVPASTRHIHCRLQTRGLDCLLPLQRLCIGMAASDCIVTVDGARSMPSVSTQASWVPSLRDPLCLWWQSTVVWSAHQDLHIDSQLNGANRSRARSWRLPIASRSA